MAQDFRVNFLEESFPGRPLKNVRSPQQELPGAKNIKMAWRGHKRISKIMVPVICSPFRCHTLEIMRSENECHMPRAHLGMNA